MLNNKAYVLTPVLLLLLFLLSLSVSNHFNALIGRFYEGVLAESLLSKHSFTLDRYLLNVISAETLKAYSLMSQARSLEELEFLFSNNKINVSIGKEGVFIFVYVHGLNVSEPCINMSILPLEVSKNIDYPILLFLEELNGFNPVLVQNCLDSSHCSYNNYHNVLLFCLNNYRSDRNISLINTSLPAFENNKLQVNLSFVNELNITKLFPYSLGSFSFNC